MQISRKVLMNLPNIESTVCAVAPAERAISPSVRPIGLPVICVVLYLLISCLLSTMNLLKPF